MDSDNEDLTRDLPRKQNVNMRTINRRLMRLEDQLSSIQGNLLGVLDTVRTVSARGPATSQDVFAYQRTAIDEEQTFSGLVGGLLMFALGFMTFYNLQPHFRNRSGGIAGSTL